MFCPLSYRDTLLIGRSLLVLIIAIILGVSVTEHQLNSLTLREEYIQVFDMNRDTSGLYSLSIFGYNYSVSAMVPVADIVNGYEDIDIQTSICTLHIPKRLHINCEKELHWLTLQVNWLEESTIEVWHKINVYIRQFR